MLENNADREVCEVTVHDAESVRRDLSRGRVTVWGKSFNSTGGPSVWSVAETVVRMFPRKIVALVRTQ